MSDNIVDVIGDADPWDDWGRGWAVYANNDCPQCGLTVTDVVPIGVMGYECHKCGYVDNDYEWIYPEPYANDGGWLTGIATTPEVEWPG